MSLNSAASLEGIRSEMTPAVSSHQAAASLRFGAPPLLQPSSYASWRPRMEAYLMRQGLEEAYKDELASWTELHAKVREWDLASKARAISSALGRLSTASASSGPSSAPKKNRSRRREREA